MVEYFKTRLEVFFKYRHLLKNLVGRDIKVKYRRSALGLLWSVLNPLLMMLVMTAVFSYMFNQDPKVYAVYLLSGQLMFNFFNEGTNLAMDSVLGNSSLIKKVYIPKYIFPFAKVTFSLVNAGFSLIALVLVMVIVQAPISPWTLLFPVPMFLLFLFNIGVGMILASFVVFFRDIKHLYGVLVVALTYMTPIFYFEESLPAFMQTVIRFNPIYWYVTMFRQLILNGQPPSIYQWIATVGCAALALILGFSIFKRTQDRFILFI